MADQGSENIWEMRHRCKQSITSQGDSKTQERLTKKEYHCSKCKTRYRPLIKNREQQQGAKIKSQPP